MNDFSTLIYFVNNFYSDVNSATKNAEKEDVEKVLTSMDFEPSEQTINNILSFAASYEVMETENVGCVEMNLN